MMHKANTEYPEYVNLLKGRLTEKRFLHSLAVAKEAERLAEIHGVDADKAYLAGLLHDVTKNTSEEEHLKIFDTFGIILTNVEFNAKKLWHAISGAAFIKYVLLIDDEEIIDAVRYHTTAKAGMSLFSKILYLADYTSLDRDYDDVDVIRGILDKSLDEAFLYALRYSITELADSGRALHPDTVEAYNEVVLKGVVLSGS